MLHLLPEEAVSVVTQGGVIAYPTEAVYGLGCDPDNDAAIEQLLSLKQRPWQKGLILVASQFEQLLPYIDESQLTGEMINAAFDRWPGPFTFIMPVNPSVSKLLCGDFNSIAVRVSAHSGVRRLCDALNKPLVSTSANLSGQAPAMNQQEIITQFDGKLAALIEGELGGHESPSNIIDIKTGQVLR